MKSIGTMKYETPANMKLNPSKFRCCLLFKIFCFENNPPYGIAVLQISTIIIPINCRFTFVDTEDVFWNNQMTATLSEGIHMLYCICICKLIHPVALFTATKQ